jgi:hypothetical protein
MRSCAVAERVFFNRTPTQFFVRRRPGRAASQQFGISVSDDTVYRALKDLSFSHFSARPKAYK